ncbi:Uncharacterized protein SCF082_LOCUS13081 [Durusdinium trenchii]|uniref:DUF4267 domain-containing protein n=1 Tax=Durusdinium trenchii TaxID=1381693 RepID=A0ABP0JP35_9DINO
MTRWVHTAVRVGCCFVGLGASCFASPISAAESYGFLTTDEDTLRWVKVTGIRDLSLGVATLALFFLYPPAIRVFAPSAMFVTLGDAVTRLILRQHSAPYQHHFGSLVLLVLSVCAWLDPRLDMSDQKYQ